MQQHTLKKWFMAAYILNAHKKGISSYQLAKDIGVAQKSAWFMMHRIRESMRDKVTIQLNGIVEADETYMAGKYGSEYKGIVNQEEAFHPTQSSTESKGAVLGLAERNTGRVIITRFEDRKANHIRPAISSTLRRVLYFIPMNQSSIE
jgi:hypothetical protein